MRKSWCAVFVVCGCNQLLGLHQTQPTPDIDAQFFDAAPFACPAIGTAPQIARVLHQDVVQPVQDYTVSETLGRAMALDATDFVTEGPVDGVMTRAQGIPGGASGSVAIDSPRLVPEGDEAYVRKTVIGASTIQLYRRESGVWAYVSDLAIPIAQSDVLSEVTRGPTRRMVVYVDSDLTLHEYSFDDSGGASEIKPAYNASDFGLFLARYPTLSSDGLRLIVRGEATASDPEKMYYADRPDLMSRFVMRSALAMPAVATTYLTDDCGRIYFSGLESVWYVEQQR